MHRAERETASRKRRVEAERQHGAVRIRTCRSLHHPAKLGHGIDVELLAVAEAFHTRPRAVLAKQPFDHLP
jgi:predicted ABC-type transport system involved in lysophospholipase L1 biosynthesis ATPase subunit